VTPGSVPDTTTYYRPALRAPYRDVTIRETGGGATECMFGQQMDENKALLTRPTCAPYFIEVEARSGGRMLHEMLSSARRYDTPGTNSRPSTWLGYERKAAPTWKGD
jgi:hypothetical protein